LRLSDVEEALAKLSEPWTPTPFEESRSERVQVERSPSGSGEPRNRAERRAKARAEKRLRARQKRAGARGASRASGDSPEALARREEAQRARERLLSSAEVGELLDDLLGGLHG
jgi:hypothetical protein